MFSSSQQELEATSQQLQATSESLASTHNQLVVSRTDLYKTRKERDEKDFLVEEHLRTEQTLLREAEEVNQTSIQGTQAHSYWNQLTCCINCLRLRDTCLRAMRSILEADAEFCNQK